MTASELKEKIKKKLNDIEDITLLKEVDSIVNFISSEKDDYNSLPEEVKQSIEEGMSQLDNGKKLSYEEVRRRNSRWFTR